MKRRGFIKNMSRAGMAPLLLGGIPVNALGQFNRLQEVAAQSDSDRVLVLVQIHGGNDGLNTLVPLDQYDLYKELRTNIALPNKGARKYITLDSGLSGSKQLGLHPELSPLKELYEQERVAIAQSVAYPNMNGSHFRSRDVWFMGGNSDQNLRSGWAARYLDKTFPGYPDDYPSKAMLDPIALEIGNRTSLAFHRADGVPIGMTVNKPKNFDRLITGSDGKLPAGINPEGFYGKTLRYIMDIENKSSQYAERLQQLYQQGKNQVEYPERYDGQAFGNVVYNRLSPQLQMIARLLSGGSKTKIFLARISGFDTHGNQVEHNDTTRGTHAVLLHNLFHAIKAFQDDLVKLGIEDRVMTVTFSEFGRRVTSNDNRGTDHGNAAPMFVFGKNVQPGVVGDNANLSKLDGGSVAQQYDYRQVFATLLEDWLGASSSAIASARFSEYAKDKLPLVAKSTEATKRSAQNAVALNNASAASPDDSYYLFDIYPNPAIDRVTLRFKVSGQKSYQLTIADKMGSTVENISGVAQETDTFTKELSLSGLKPGVYYYTLVVGNGLFRTSKQFMKE